MPFFTIAYKFEKQTPGQFRLSGRREGLNTSSSVPAIGNGAKFLVCIEFDLRNRE